MKQSTSAGDDSSSHSQQNYLHFTEHCLSLACSQRPQTSPNLQTDQLCATSRATSPKLPSHLSPLSSKRSQPCRSATNSPHPHLTTPAVSSARHQQYLLCNTHHAVPHYALFSSNMSLDNFQARISNNSNIFIYCNWVVTR